MERRIYTEQYLEKRRRLDPCLMCEEHNSCYKQEVKFIKSTQTSENCIGGRCKNGC